MKAMNPEFQPMLDEGEALKEQLISTSHKDNRSSLRFELIAWFNSVKSVINQTQGIYYQGTESLDSLIEFAEFYLASGTPKDAANQIDRVIEMIASIPLTRESSVKTPSLEINPALSINLKLHDLIALCHAALRPSRKPWGQFLKHLSELESTRTLRPDEDVSILVSRLIQDLLGNSDVDSDDTDRLTRNIAEEYERLKLALEGIVFHIAWLISGITFMIPAILIIVGAIELIFGHPFHGGLIGVLIGIAIIVFIIMEVFGILQHLGHLRSKLESLILPRLRRALGAEESPKPHVLSVLGLDSTVRDKQKNL